MLFAANISANVRAAQQISVTLFCLLLVPMPGLAAPANEQFSSGSTTKPSAQLGSDTSVCNDPRIAQREAQTGTTARLFPYLVGGGKEGQLARVLEETVGVTNGNGACNGHPGVVEFINNGRIGAANQLADEVFAASGTSNNTPPTLLAQGMPTGYSGGPGPGGVGPGQTYSGPHPGPAGANCQKGAPGAYDPSQNPNCPQQQMPMATPVLRSPAAPPLTANASQTTKIINGVPYVKLTVGKESGYFDPAKPYYNSKGKYVLKAPYLPSQLTIDLRVPGTDRLLEAASETGPKTLEAELAAITKNQAGVITAVELHFHQFTTPPEYLIVPLYQSNTPAATPANPAATPFRQY
jgi:hypothetical protein